MLILSSQIPGLMMSKGFASASAQQANRPKTLEAIVLSQRLNDCFASLQDPRVERTRLHQLSDILTIAYWRCCLEAMAGKIWKSESVNKRGYRHF